MKNKRIAIVTDWMWYPRGSEKILDVICEIFPKADIFMLFGSKEKFKEYPNIYNKNIIYSLLNELPFIQKYYRYTYFLWPFFIEQFDFSNYDLVVSISSSVAKGIVVSTNTKHISYVNSPMRYAWDLKDEYFNNGIFHKWKELIIPFFLHYLRIWDTQSNRFDTLIVNSKYISKRIEKYWGIKDTKVIYPYFVDNKSTIRRNNIEKGKNNRYLYFGALEPNKSVLNLIKSANKYKFNLDISGVGSLLNQIIKESVGNIRYIGYVSDKEKLELMSKYKALIFPSIEDFGIVGLEAMSVGIPIIVQKESGISEVVNNKNGVIIEDNSIEEIFKGINNIEKMKFDKNEIISSVKEYSRENFIKKIKIVVNSVLES